MNRNAKFGLAAAALVNSLLMLSPSIDARENRGNPGNPGNPGNAAQAEQAARAQQEQEMRGQEQTARNQQAQERQALQASQRAQEQSLASQEQAARTQQQQAREQQQQARQQQEQAERAQEEQARQQQPVARTQQPARNQPQRAATDFAGQRNSGFGGTNAAASAPSNGSISGGNRGSRNNRQNDIASQMPASAPAFQNLRRPSSPRALNTATLPLEKAVSMPVLQPNATAEQRSHVDQMTHNMQAHLLAVPGNQGPSNINATRRNWGSQYFNNYPVTINNQPFFINRQNTMVSFIPPAQYPWWFGSQPGWVFANGFTLCSAFQVGLDWLRWGWHPYFGPLPDGFVCASDYIPTPWIYFPAMGLWREPGINAYASAGPGYDYTGPISVEVLEPRNVNVTDPYSGGTDVQTINVVYMYNAYFYPDYDRWGYMNRHGYFIWLNT